MNIVRFIYTFILLLTLICAAGLIRYAYKRRTMPGAKYFIAYAAFMMLYSGAYIGEINSNSLSSAMFWFSIEHIPISILPYLWIMMSLDYVKIYKKHIKVAKYIMLYHPVLQAISFYTNDMTHMYIQSYKFVSNGYFPVIASEKGFLYIVNIGSITVIGLMCIAIYIHGYLRSVKTHRNAYIVMIIASIFPWISSFDVGYLGIDYFPVISIITGLLYMYGIFHYRIFNAIPIAKEMVFRQSKEAILLIDLAGCIIDANDAFIKIYPEVNHLIKKNFKEVFVKSHEELQGRFDEKGKFKYQKIVNGQVVYYSAELISILTEEDIAVGKIFAINDITLFVEKQKKLELIASSAMDEAEKNELSFLQAQIKPHFINNTLSVISSMITRDPAAAKELVVNLSEYLINCYSHGTKSPMGSIQEELEIVNTYISIEKARFRERLNYKLIYDDDIAVSIPRFVLQPLIENSIRHGILKKVEGGNVTLQISRDKCKVYFQINDDGVGISEERIELLLEGKENNQGVGISNVNKRLVKYYGEGLKIVSTIGQGTTVLFSIPLECI